jgi:acyl-CoA reductase-like NAD-dependent aldehyde dehydrogenase
MERIFVHAAVAAEFTDALVAVTRGLAVGDPLDPATALGPVATAGQRAHVEAQIAQAVAAGGELLVGGSRPERPGFFHQPTLIRGAGPGTALYDDETFGPASVLTTVDSLEAGVALAADNRYGLAATFLSGDPERAERLALELDTGVCWINEWQGGAPGALYEPARISGQGVVGNLDAVTRPMLVHRGPAGSA